jgi:hypothetical protein
VGSRQWGHPAISSLLRVKIYDFAMYMDGKEVCSFLTFGSDSPKHGCMRISAHRTHA